MKAKNIFFGVHDQLEEEDIKVSLNTFEPDPQTTQYAGTVVVSAELAAAYVDSQQLAELGMLFVAVAGTFDEDSVCELLDGYGAQPADLKELANTLRTTAEKIDDYWKETTNPGEIWKQPKIVQWQDVVDWEKHLVPGCKLVTEGSNSCLYFSTLLEKRGGDLRIRYADGREFYPCYIERLRQFETVDTIYRIVRN